MSLFFLLLIFWHIGAGIVKLQQLTMQNFY